MPTQIAKKLYSKFCKAVKEYEMVQSGDNVLVCLSGGKDSYSMVTFFQQLQRQSDFSFRVYTLDQTQPGWDDSKMCEWLEMNQLDYEIESRNTYKVVKEKIPENKTYCSLCSRLRRGNIYRYAKENQFNKVALGHHRDDTIESLMMSMLYAGKVKAMPPKYTTDDGRLEVIRPLILCEEADILKFAAQQKFPIIPCNLCGSQDNLARQKVKKLIAQLAQENDKIPANLLNAVLHLPE